MGVSKTDPSGEQVEERTGLARHGELLLAIAGILLGVVVFALVPQLRHAFVLSLHGNLSGLRHYIKGLAVGGVLLLLALMLAHAVVLYPTEILTATTAYVYGFLPGLGIVLVGWMLSAWLSFALGRSIGRPLLLAVLGPRFRRLERAMERGGVQLMLSARLIPIVPFSLLGYVAGATRESIWRFTWTTAVGYLPLTVAVAYLGSRAKSLSANDPLVWAAVAIVIALLVAAHRFRARTDL